MGVLSKYQIQTPKKPKHPTALKVGPYATHNDRPFECVKLVVKTVVSEQFQELIAVTEIQYTFRNDFRDAELYYPVSELSGISGTFTLLFNGEDVRGRLNPMQVDPSTLPPRVDIAPQGSHGENPPIVYQCYKGDATTDLDVGKLSVLSAKFTYTLPTTISYPGGAYLWVFPLSVLVKPPDAVTFTFTSKNRKIQSLKCYVDDRTWVDLVQNGSKSEVTLRDPAKLVRPVQSGHLLLELDFTGTGGLWWVTILPTLVTVVVVILAFYWYLPYHKK